jgi:hypothetical protein
MNPFPAAVHYIIPSNNFVCPGPPIADAGPDQTVAVDSNCTAFVTLDGSGSYDPEGNPLTYIWTFDGGSTNGINPTIELPLGNYTIALVVNDGTEESAPDYVDISTIDNTPPVVNCNATTTIKPPDTPLTFTATATDHCDANSIVVIPDWDSFKYTKKGRRVTKKDSAMVEIAGNRIIILDSGGVGNNISWTVIATDESGNTGTTECTVEVINPSFVR